MEYTVEDVSPVVKKVAVSVPKEEVNASIAAAVALYKSSVQIDGFRKGKVPNSLIEQRFHDKVYAESREDLINLHISQIFSETKSKPVGGLQVDDSADNFKRDQDFAYSFTFEHLPSFELPKYEGLDVDVVSQTVTDKDVDDVIQLLRKRHAKLVPVEGDAPAVEGQFANVDFQLFDEEGNLLKDIKGDNFDLEIGAHQALPAFEDIVKELRPGERKESPLTFPDDFLNPALAGKTVRVKVSVNAVKRLDLPELTDTFAQSLGYDSCDALREAMRKGREQSIASIQKSEAQGKLIDNLLKVVDFPLPPSMLDLQINLRVMNLISSMEKQGRSVASLGKTNDELKALARPAAEHVTRSLVLLLKIAEKENLQVTETEVQKEIFNEAQANHEDYNALRERYIRTGLIFSVQDRLLADKAADLVYARANIKEVEAAPEQNSDANPSSETSAQE